MKRRSGFLLLCLTVLSLSSCLEITQYAGMDGSRLVVDTRISIQKALIEMARSMGGGDADSIFDGLDIEGMRSSLPSNYLLAIEKFDTDLEMGVSLRVKYDPYMVVPYSGDSEIPVFFPYLDGKTLVVEIKSLDPSGETEGNAIAATVISGFKYRLFIGRSLLPAPEAAFMLSDRGETPATLIVYPEFSVVEISMGYILSAAGSIKLVVE